MYDTRLAFSLVRAQKRVARRCALAMHSGGRVGVTDWYAGDIDQGTVHYVLFVQYAYLATERAETYRKICILIYLLTYICPSSFDCEVNASFWIFVISNSKSGRFSSFLMQNIFGTGQKKAYFLGALEN